jgi:hypothetical protein
MVVLDESAVAEQGAAEVGEGLEVFGFAVVAADESAVVLEPGQAALDDPAVAAEALGGFDTLAGDADCDAASADLFAQGADVVGLVAVEFVGSVSGPAASAAHWCDGVQQWDE